MLGFVGGPNEPRHFSRPEVRFFEPSEQEEITHRERKEGMKAKLKSRSSSGRLSVGGLFSAPVKLELRPQHFLRIQNADSLGCSLEDNK